ncbi:MAG: endonuclease [Cereibacter sphaeroides]|uniref:Endonuclease n=1 Tax=Cereibacter sphaeroides TaxID=1063 RepID=A0A2W5SLF1_CERSP|nr:MAG: endonuclease [Cereibacter sphaeroides]
MADFPRLQLAVGLAVVLALVLWHSDEPMDELLAVVLALCLTYQLARVLPYTPLWPRQVADAKGLLGAPRLRILIANVLMENRDAAPLLALIKEHAPDVVLLVETDGWWAERLLAVESRYSHVLRRPQGNHYGLHFMSKIPVEDIEVRRLVSEDVPSVRARLMLAPGREVEFHGLHPRPPVPGQDSDERDAEILIVAREVRERGMPAIVAGDLNDVAWSHTTRLFQRISGLLDPRRGRGTFSTFPVDYPMLRWPLDHVFHDASFRLVRLVRLPSIGSDHFPMMIDLAQEASAEADQPAPQPDRADIEEAEEMIRQGLKVAGGERQMPEIKRPTY